MVILVYANTFMYIIHNIIFLNFVSLLVPAETAEPIFTGLSVADDINYNSDYFLDRHWPAALPAVDVLLLLYRGVQ